LSQLLVAQRYAKALMQIAEKQNNVSGIKQEMGEIIDMAKSQPDFERLCLHPLFTLSRKATALNEILKNAGASETLRRFFIVVAKAGRLNLIYELAIAYNDLFDKRQGVLSAAVTTAQPLSETQAQILSESFSKRMGKKMRFVLQTDPSLLGGLKIQVGSTIYDASLQGRLRTLRARMLST
jgi:F-type H+-transporting ATPase subunit delta